MARQVLRMRITRLPPVRPMQERAPHAAQPDQPRHGQAVSVRSMFRGGGGVNIYNAINVDGVRWGSAAIDAGAERRRAHAKHSAKGKSAEQMHWTDPFWLPVLVEEVG